MQPHTTKLEHVEETDKFIQPDKHNSAFKPFLRTSLNDDFIKQEHPSLKKSQNNVTTFSFYPNIKENKAEENKIFSTLGKNNSKIEITVTITRQHDKKENNLIANVKQENLNIYEAIKNELED